MTGNEDGSRAVGSLADPVEESALLQAWWRSRESDRTEPLIRDPFAARFAARLVTPEVSARFLSSPANELGHEIHVQSVRVADNALLDWHRPLDAPQIVLLGAGLDSRPARLAWARPVRFFLVDRPGVLAVWRSEFAQDGHTTLVPGNLAKPQLLLQDLAQAGLDCSLPVAWVAEGVTEFLGTVRSVDLATQLCSASAPGSLQIVQTLDEEFVRVGRALGGTPWRRVPAPGEIAAALQPWRVRDLSRDFVARAPDVRGLVHVFEAVA